MHLKRKLNKNWFSP